MKGVIECIIILYTHQRMCIISVLCVITCDQSRCPHFSARHKFNNIVEVYVRGLMEGCKGTPLYLLQKDSHIVFLKIPRLDTKVY